MNTAKRTKKQISYPEMIDYLYGLQKYGIKFGLSKTTNLLKAFGNPQRARDFVHIGGSNGKGSVAAMLEAVLMASGLRVGFYSSPHLVRFTERFRVNGREMSPDEATGIAVELMDAIHPEEPPTFFEAATAMALIYFARKKTDVAIMEVGMGGRLDATNVISPLVSVITNISLEHQEYLGRRLVDIAGEKAGIIKEGVDLVTGATQPRVIGLFRSICEERAAPFWRVGKEFRYRSHGGKFSYYGVGRTLQGLDLKLRGWHQNRNAAMALGIVEILDRKGYRVSTGNIMEGLHNTHWPGRLQIVSRDPLIVLDGGHNPAAVRNLALAVQRDFRYARLFLVLGVMGDKDIRRIVRAIVPLADYVIYTSPDYFRSARPEDLLREAAPLNRPGEILPRIPDALDKARELADPGDMILVCGSLFTVGEALTYLDPASFKPDGIR
ncbi:MAG: bifunctional folylpolyglutamate synthase/dihydrofolate synthase [Deltaproteobacteria bacterium]|nr:bifunctional folylpolyglutamate synthase/dihydrofolate synthase [Deltaproteobacteria bacterium]